METKRPTNPAAEEILGGYFPVLDHGFVALVDYMGSDEDVERAARVSYGHGTRKRSRTRGLIRYLRRHRHTTPSEMVDLKFHCCMPIFVARQWIRHRTACLAKGTDVYFDLPGGIRRRGNQLYKLPIEEIWRRFQPTRNRTRPDKQRNPYFRRDRVRKMHLRQVDEDTLEMRHTRVVDVYRNGRKPVFRMTLSDGKEIEATADHRFLFADGWNTLADETGLREKGGRAVWEDGDHFLYVNGERGGSGAPCPDAEPQLVSARSREPAWTEGLGPSVKEEWKPRPRIPWNKLTRARLVRIERFEYVGQKETYDLEVEGPHHNFVANGIVTHNSVNEYSGRYSLMPLLFYTPDADAFALQSRANRQGRDERAAEETYREAVRRWNRIREEAGQGYEWMVGEDVARELARIDLPTSVYTQWYWKMDLHNLFHFLSLRVDPHAQREIREYGKVMAGMVKRVAPLSFEAWADYELAGAHLSLAERRALARLVEADRDGGEVRVRTGEREAEAEAPAARSLDEEALRELGMSGREIREFLAKLDPPEPEDFELDLSRMRPAEEFAEKMAEAVPEVDRDGEQEG